MNAEQHLRADPEGRFEDLDRLARYYATAMECGVSLRLNCLDHEDLRQEAALAILSRRSPEIRSRPGIYFSGVVRNRLKDMAIRDMAQKRRTSAAYWPSVFGPEQEARATLANLDDRDSTIVRWRSAGYSIPEIARRTGISQRTIDRRSKAIKEALR